MDFLNSNVQKQIHNVNKPTRGQYNTKKMQEVTPSSPRRLGNILVLEDEDELYDFEGEGGLYGDNESVSWEDIVSEGAATLLGKRDLELDDDGSDDGSDNEMDSPLRPMKVHKG
jgi:hypothetical protein